MLSQSALASNITIASPVSGTTVFFAVDTLVAKPLKAVE
jgi:hypothetical protein